MNLALSLNADPVSTLPDFPVRFHTTEPSPGRLLILREKEDRQVVLSNKEDVINEVLQFVHIGALGGMGEWNEWTYATVKGFVDFWAAVSEPIPMPQAWAWNDDQSLAFHRLPWTRSTHGDAPTWAELLSRMSNPQSFMAWVGSLFVPESDRQTYVWLYGEGQNGKGSIIRFLRKVFADACSSETVPAREDKFWTYGLLGKRLVMFADTNNAAWPASGLFKSLTGGDPIKMEIKGGASFTSDIVAKFLFASNERPGLSSEVADMRRAILCELQAIAGSPEPRYEARLWEEGGAFITSCLEAYSRLCPNHEAISSDHGELEEWVGALEDKYRAVVEHDMLITPLIENEKRGNQVYLSGTHMTIFLHERFKNPKDISEFYKYLERKHHIKRTTIRTNGGIRDNGFLGVELTEPWLHRVINCGKTRHYR